MTIKNFFLIILILIVPLSAYAENDSENTDIDLPGGIVFNSKNLLMELDSFESGIGYKFFPNNVSSFIIIGDFYYSNSLDTLSFTAGLNYLHYFNELSKINPFLSGYLDVGFISQSTISDDNNWIKNRDFPINGGIKIGSEYFILDYLSFFAEYRINLNFTTIISETNTAGTIVKTTNYSSEIDTGIGNNFNIGVVLYFDEVMHISKNKLSFFNTED